MPRRSSASPARSASSSAATPRSPNSYRASPYYRNNTNDYRLELVRHLRRGLFPGDRPPQADGWRALQQRQEDGQRADDPVLDDNGFVAGHWHEQLRFCVPYGSTNISQAFNYANLDYDPMQAGQPAVPDRQGRLLRSHRTRGHRLQDHRREPALCLLLARLQVGRHQSAAVAGLRACRRRSRPNSSTRSRSVRRTPSSTAACGSTSPASTTSTRACRSAASSQRTAVNDNINANIYGVEADAIVEPIRAFAVNVGFSYLKTSGRGDTFFANPRDPSGGRGDAVIIKDITTAANCAVVPTVAGNARRCATATSRAINGGRSACRPRPPFPANSGIQGTPPAPSASARRCAGNAAAVGAAVRRRQRRQRRRPGQRPRQPAAAVAEVQGVGGRQYTIELGTAA